MAIELTLGTALAAIGAGVAVGFAALGSGIGQGIAAAGSVGAVAEDSSMFAQGIVFTAIPETQAIYGFLIAILLLVFSGIMGGHSLDTLTGLVAVGAGAAVGFACLGSGMGQGITSSASIGAVVENPSMFAQGIVFTAIPETQAIYGFLIAILLLVFGGII
jgi:V/A-type H+-transporting ATPase subunit K